MESRLEDNPSQIIMTTELITKPWCTDVITFCNPANSIYLMWIQISVYAVPEKIDQAEFALDAAVKLLDFYDDYFDIPYPLPKQG